MGSYVLARICEERHHSYAIALENVAGQLTGERYYTRKETPPRIMRRTPMVGIGNHGGRDLFTLGVCSGLAWQELREASLPYRHRIVRSAVSPPLALSCFARPRHRRC